MDESIEREDGGRESVEAAGPGASPPDMDGARRFFLKTGIRSALFLLPYVTPAIETIFLSDAAANDDGDRDDGGEQLRPGNRNWNWNGRPSPIANIPPPGNFNFNSGNHNR